MNIAKAAAASSTMRTLERFVYSSLSDARKWSGGKYTWVYHFDAKAEVVKKIKGEFPALAERMSTLQIGEYATNWKTLPSLGPQKVGERSSICSGACTDSLQQPDGSYLLVKPCRGDAPIPMVVTAKDTGSFVRGLIQSPPGTNLLGYGSLIGWTEYMRLWSSILQVSGKFQQVPADKYVEKLPAALAKELQEAYAYQAEFGWDGGDPSVVHPKDVGRSISGASSCIENCH